MTTRRFTTRVAPWAALAVAAIGSPLITSQAAQAAPSTLIAGISPSTGLEGCSTSDGPSMTITLTGDCSTFDSILVPDGWTVDGAGHTITAVQDGEHPTFPGGVLESAVGDDEAPATLNVRNLTINSSGFETAAADSDDSSLSGIYLNRAGGSITNVHVDDISHGRPSQEGYGVLARNFVTTSNLDVPRANLTISGLTVSNYEKSGLKIDGNIAFTADHLDIGAAAASDGTPLTSLAANGVTIVRSARGSLTDSTIGQNRYSTDDEDPTGEHTPATSVLLYDAGRVTVSHNVIGGADGDTGIAINNFSNTIDTIASFTCNAITRTDGGNADSDFGDAIYNDTTSTDAVNLTVGSNTYSGWTTNVYGPATTSPDPTCTTSTTATPSTSTVTSGHAITVTGAVTNTDGSAAPGGTATLLKRESGVSGFSAVATKTTRTNGSYVFRTTPEQGTSYKVSFSKPRFTDSTSPAFWVAVAPAVTIHATPKNLNRGGSVSFTGTSSPAMAGHNVSLMQYSAKAWHVVDTGTLTEEGGYTFTWTAAAKGSPVFQVRVEKAAGFLTGISPNVTLKVS